MIKPIAIALLTVSLISGCAEPITERVADRVADRVSIQLDIVPVTYSISIKVKNGEQNKASAKLAAFTDKYWQTIANRGARISWQTKVGKTLAQQYYTQLAARGVNVSDLYLIHMDAGQNTVDKKSLAVDKEYLTVNKKFFDIEVTTTVHKVISDVCQSPIIGHYGELVEGCSSESNRWKSMVHPEKMLNNSRID
jgi:hypothetical protein